MRFLSKQNNSPIILQQLSYNIQSQRLSIKQVLMEEQIGFCAYSERYIRKTDEVHIEHFDGRLKHTPHDNYHNWYAVLARMNSTKAKKIEPYLPILPPDSHLQERIHYISGIFVSIHDNDVEADNLINYLGFNKHDLVTDRTNHIARVQLLKTYLPDDFELYLQEHPEELSFISALEVELNMSLRHLLPTPDTNSHI